MENKKHYPGILGNIYRKLELLKISPKIIFMLMGIASTLWFIIRVVPKPQRAGYPCMQAVAPIMSGFVIYILTLGGSVLLFRKSISRFKNARYWSAGFALILCLVLLVAFNYRDAQQLYANTIGFTRGELPDGANNPMGVARGINPGRVMWVWNPDATDVNCKNTISDAYFMPENNNLDTINNMADISIRKLAGKGTINEAWDAIFKDFNLRKTGTATGYTAGQKIFIKINNGQAGWAIDYSDLSETGNNSSTGVKNAAMSNTTPFTVAAYIRQLVDSCGIPEENIYVGEPMTHVYKSMYDAIAENYPGVKVMDKDGNTSLGRTHSSGWTDNVIFYSDKGAEMPDAIQDRMMNEMYNADYLINIAALKAHARAGITLNAKLHFGSHGDHPGYGYGSFHLHDGLIATVDNDVLNTGARGEYGMYRVLVDLMGHSKLGGNTVLFVVDGLWGGIEATDMPVKWKSAPFNNDFPSSLFVSQDEIALESVCLDFLRAEADVNTAFKDRPFFPAVDDYLHQGADPENWAEGISYDPDDDGTPIGSLGVHEHWNNATDKKYSRDLNTGEGIELYRVLPGTTSSINIENGQSFNMEIFPNPCTLETQVSFDLLNSAKVSLYMINAEGKVVRTIRNEHLNTGSYNNTISTTGLATGMYFCILRTISGNNDITNTIKVQVN